MKSEKNFNLPTPETQSIELTPTKAEEGSKRLKLRIGIAGATLVGFYFSSSALALSDNNLKNNTVAISPYDPNPDSDPDSSDTTTFPADYAVETLPDSDPDSSDTTTFPADYAVETLPDDTVVVTYPDDTVVIIPPPPYTTTPAPNTDVPITPPTTSPETTLPPKPLQGLSISFSENNETNYTAPGETITYSVSLTNPDDVVKVVSMRAGFIDSFAMDRITAIRVSDCGSYEIDSGPLHVYLNSIRLEPNQICRIEYDALVAHSDKSITSYVTISDETAGENINKRFATIYS